MIKGKVIMKYSKNYETISAQVAEVLVKLNPGHTRSEAFHAINKAKISDKNGNLIIPSVWYHALCYNKNKEGLTYMEEIHPSFVPTPSPYPRSEIIQRENSVSTNVEISRLRTKMIKRFEEISQAHYKMLKEFEEVIENNRFKVA